MKRLTQVLLTLSVLMVTANSGFANDSLLNFGREELVQADGLDIQVPGYSVPSFGDWNNDNLNDLIVGEGGGFGDAKVRVYLNVGTESEPQFSEPFYARSYAQDLTVPASGCLGCFPRLVHWNREVDDLKDLLIGQADGTVKIFMNVGSAEEPFFDYGEVIRVGLEHAPLDVGKRATPNLVDWDNDQLLDLVVGALDGSIRVFINCSCSAYGIPSFNYSPTGGDFVLAEDGPLVVPGGRSSPAIVDLDRDGKKDILTGNTYGQLLFYKNLGTDEAPSFSEPNDVTSEGNLIDLPESPRSRPSVCYWTGDGSIDSFDGYLDVLIGSGDGKVRLYRGFPMREDLDLDGDVDFHDFALLADRWNVPPTRPRDNSQ